MCMKVCCCRFFLLLPTNFLQQWGSTDLLSKLTTYAYYLCCAGNNDMEGAGADDADELMEDEVCIHMYMYVNTH